MNNSSSSSSSSSLDCCPTFAVDVTLVPLGGCGCGIEVTDGIAYAIGTQYIGVSYSDPCGGIDAIFVNGQPPPTLVNDGCPIDVSITNNAKYNPCGKSGPNCVKPEIPSEPILSIILGMAPTGGLRFKVNKKEVIRRLRKKKKNSRP